MRTISASVKRALSHLFHGGRARAPCGERNGALRGTHGACHRWCVTHAQRRRCLGVAVRARRAPAARRHRRDRALGVSPRRPSGRRGSGRRPVRTLCETSAMVDATATDAAGSAALDRYEAVIGIEVHCQLKTASKMFCGCSNAYADAPPNSHVCPVCLGLPGTLPTINRRAVEHVLATGVAIAARDAAGDPLGPQELLLSGPAEGLPDQPVRPAAGRERAPGVRDERGPRHDPDHPGPPGGGHGQAHPLDRRRRPPGQPRRLQPVGRAADGDRHRARRPDRRAGPPLRRGAPGAAPRDRCQRRRHGARPDAGRGERLAPAARHRAVRDAGRGQEHELVPLGRAGDRVRDRAPGGRARRRRDPDPGHPRLGRGSRPDVRDAVEGGQPRLPLLPGAGPAAAPGRRGLARLDPRPRCPSCRPTGGPATRGDLGLSPYDAAVLVGEPKASELFEAARAAAPGARPEGRRELGDRHLARPAEVRSRGRGAASIRASSPTSSAGSRAASCPGTNAKEVFAAHAADGSSVASIVETRGLRQISDASALAGVVEEVVGGEPEGGRRLPRGQAGPRLLRRPGDEGDPRPGERGARPGGGPRATRARRRTRRRRIRR